MINRAKDPRAFLNTVILNMYANAQLQRWQSENSSETGQWTQLNQKYAKYKKKRFASFPGAGNALMIATGKLSMAASLRGPGYKKLVSVNSLEVSIDDTVIPYAKYAAVKRPIMQFGGATIESMKTVLGKYLMTGESNG